MKCIIKIWHVLGRSIKKCGFFLKYIVLLQFPKQWLLVTSSASKSVPLQSLQRAKLLISSCRRIGETILQQLLAKPSDNCCYSLFSEAATRSVLQTRCSLKNCKIHRKAPMLETCFNEVAGPHAYFPVNFAKLLKTHFYRTAPVAVSDYSGLCNFVSKSNSSTTLVKENYLDFIQIYQISIFP